MSEPIPAATVILLRDPLEVFLVRRHARSGFMANAYVFPGGKVDEADRAGAPGPLDAARVAGARELAEEAGVTVPPASLVHWSHWITPAIEPRRFAAHFFVARMPAGQTAKHDVHETTDELWIAPAEALLRQARGELTLPPPTVRNLEELEGLADVDAVLAAGRTREPHVLPILPKALGTPAGFTLLWPWDAAYAAASGEGIAWPGGHPLAHGTSRVTLVDGRYWRSSIGE
jgi:8-oxo-dGTP pyrophosphatase MutT (NUDIX family)